MEHNQNNIPTPDDLQSICQRVQAKSESYEKYNFSRRHNDFLKAFFDLAQEYDTLDDFYRICVSVPCIMLGIYSNLYLCKDEMLKLVCSSKNGVITQPCPARYPVQIHETPYEMSGSYIIPIFSKYAFAPTSIHENRHKHESSHRQTSLWNDIQGNCESGRILGMYEILVPEGICEEDKFFFAKYANRIGYNLDNRLIALQNIEHLKFINSLVVDIEHNIIVPNMYFKHLFNQLKKKIDRIDQLLDSMHALEQNETVTKDDCKKCHSQLQEVQDDLLTYHQEMVKHHSNTSLFLESLFRREHFERGYLVLRPKQCYVEKDVILPQLEHYASRLQAANITIERPEDMKEEDFHIVVDIGLLAQVYANLFSNAAKYTQEVVDENGTKRKTMAYGRELVENFPGPGQKGVKFNVFTTGPHMTSSEGEGLFQEGIRGQGSSSIPGTGHGLSFIRQVIELHGGIAGYEPTPLGNNFYFILPLPSMDYPLKVFSA
ncbi:sensor histidine kinase [Desulfogranum japonicum]|uniref:sensor histidine kinase n=1 Tax=Desulfogranum japonicum TaxID=231447 RepID=UPI000420BEE2|nr:HAMP domain-containing sensor histidine kinase [Desulfogranum japonicum]